MLANIELCRFCWLGFVGIMYKTDFLVVSRCFLVWVVCWYIYAKY